jgi:O-antigen ligase
MRGGWSRHALPALAALALFCGGPHRERLAVIHAPRIVLLMALGAALLYAGRVARSSFGAVEWLGAAALGAMALSGALAVSPAYALQPVAVAAGALVVLLGTAWRTQEREVWLHWLAAAVIAVAVLGLIEAMGLGPPSLRGRAPSATMGQRNALAHFLVLGSPLVWALGLRATSPRVRAGLWAAAALIAAVVIQTRSRAAWLVGVPVVACFAVLSWRRATLALVAVLAVGVAIAAAAPVALAWRQPTPYLDTLSRLIDAGSGSGAGRIAEWKASLGLFTSAPVWGLGPGNWFVEYGLSHGGAHFSHSDWVGFLVERGVVGTALLVALGVATLLRWRGRGERALVASTLAAASGLGAFDSVLQLPAPCLLTALVSFVGLRPEAKALRSPIAGTAMALLALVGTGAFASRLLSTAEKTPFDRLELAAKLDPLDGELRFTLAEAWASAGNCEKARPHLEAVRKLLPRHPRLAAIANECGG